MRSQKRLARAFGYLTELVSGIAREDATEVKMWIEQITKLRVMEFVEQNEANAIRIFVTVNDRGRTLATIEKVKTFLIYASSKYLDRSLDSPLNERFGRVFRAYDLIKDIGEDRLGIRLVAQKRFDEDTVLRYHFLAYPADFHNWGITADAILRDALKPAINRHAAEGATPSARTALRDFVDDYSEDLACFFESLASLLARAEMDARLFKIFTSLGLSASLYPLAVRLHMRELLDQPLVAGKATTFLEALETTELRVYKTRVTNPEKDVAQLAAAARTLDATQIASRLSMFVERFMNDDRFRLRLRENVYEYKRGRPVHPVGVGGGDPTKGNGTEPLARYLEGAPRGRAHDRPRARPGVDVRARWPWLSGSRSYVSQLHRLGNLTLVEKRINSSAQGKTPEQKASEDHLYKASAYASSRQLGIAIGESKAAGKSFGAEHVEARTKEMVDFCLSRWPSRP